MSYSSRNRMTYPRLGDSGLRVSKLILGCMSYGDSSHGDWVQDEKVALEHIKSALELGINTFDTANIYSNGLSETILGNCLRHLKVEREDVVILTKLRFPTVPAKHKMTMVHHLPDPELDALGLINRYGLSRKYIFESVKASLNRLGMEYVDVLQVHRFDEHTPISETMEALHDVVKLGYARYIGMSSCYTWQFWAMQSYALQHNLTPFISMQNHYNALYREEEREMVPSLKHLGVGMIPWSPLSEGALTRPFSSESETSSIRASKDVYYSALVASEKDAPAHAINSRVSEIANKRGISMAQVALAWVLSKDFVTAPIVGSTKLGNIKDLVGALEVKLTEEEIKYIDEPYVPRGIVGHG